MMANSTPHNSLKPRWNLIFNRVMFYAKINIDYANHMKTIVLVDDTTD